MAKSVGMALRSYQLFESGRGKLDISRIYKFAQALDIDFYAVLIALEIGSPDFALRCADNKLPTVLLFALQDFDAAAADEILRLDPQILMTAFTAVFDELRSIAREREVRIEGWMDPEDLE